MGKQRFCLYIARMAGNYPVMDDIDRMMIDILQSDGRATSAALAEAKGAIIIVSSVAAFKSTLGTPAYAASKAGAASLTKTLGEAWARDGIRVNGIAPGLIWTAQALDPAHSMGAKGLKAAAPSVPLKRIGTAEEIADVVTFLVSEKARYITGQIITVDGGFTIAI